MSNLVNKFGQPLGKALQPRTFLPPSVHVLEGRYCRLTHVNASEHTESLFKNVYGAPHVSADTFTYMSLNPFPTQDAFQTYCTHMQTSKDPFFFAISDLKEPNNFVGTTSLAHFDFNNGVGEIAWVTYGTAMRKTRAATEAYFLIADYLMTTLQYRRLQWKCDTLNAPSWNAALRLGFTYEGTFHNAVIVKGHNRDTAWYSIIEEEWPRVKANFEAWLSPDNFYSAGKQIKSLSSMNYPKSRL